MNSLIGTGIATIIGMIMLSVFLPQYTKTQELMVGSYSASQIRSFSDASQAYIENNYSALLTSASGTVLTITATELKASGELSSTFVDLNYYNQTHILLIRESVAGITLEGLVLSCDGRTIEPADLAVIAQQAGPRSGLISATNTALVIGAGGHWSITAADYTNGVCAPLVGHLAALITTDETSGSSTGATPYLYRDAQTDPDLNSLFTDVDMNGNSLTELGEAFLNDGSGGLIRETGIFVSGDSINKPTCESGSPSIYLAPTTFSDNGIGRSIIAVQTYAVDEGTSWTVRLKVITENSTATGTDTVEPGSDYGRVLGIVRCK